MLVGILRENGLGERRVALTPNVIKPLAKLGFATLFEPGAGVRAGFPDTAYVAEGAICASDRHEVYAKSQLIPCVRLSLDASKASGVDLWQSGQIFVGMCDALSAPCAGVDRAAATGAAVFALELLPRITRAQSMDVLSSQATVAGYRAAVLAANEIGTMFPLLMTAAGTVAAARVFVIGAGVAGLQAIATAKRLGANVSAYDVRSAVREQVASVGGRFVEMPPSTEQAEGSGGYARVMGEEFSRQQRTFLAEAIAGQDVVITTAAVPGAQAPLLVTEEAVRRMQPGGLVIDLAAERGGNCELTRPDERVEAHGITILGPTNLAATVPHDASLMFARNVLSFLQHLAGKEGVSPERPLRLDRVDEIIESTLLMRDGMVLHPAHRIESAAVTA